MSTNCMGRLSFFSYMYKFQLTSGVNEIFCVTVRSLQGYVELSLIKINSLVRFMTVLFYIKEEWIRKKITSPWLEDPTFPAVNFYRGIYIIWYVMYMRKEDGFEPYRARWWKTTRSDVSIAAREKESGPPGDVFPYNPSYTYCGWLSRCRQNYRIKGKCNKL